jgi:PAS domain S-box-containing protein
MDPVPTRILLVEDEPMDQLAFQRLVRMAGLAYDYRVAGSVAEARLLLTAGRFDAVITDFNLSDGTAFDVLDVAVVNHTPVIVTAGLGNESIAVQAMKSGADAYLVKDPAGHYLQILPITIEHCLQHRRTEAALRENQELYQLITEYSTDVISIIDRTGLIVQVNPSVQSVLGYRPDQLIGTPAANIFQREYQVPDDIPTEAQTSLMPPLAVRTRHIDGSWRWLDTNSKLVERAGERFFLTVARDITDQRWADEALKESSEKFSKAFHASAAGIIISRADDGRILEANDSYMRLVGFERHEVIGRTTLEIRAILPRFAIDFSPRSKLTGTFAIWNLRC